MQIKILLVEDQKLMRIGIKSLFSDYPDLEIIGEAVNGKEATKAAVPPKVKASSIGRATTTSSAIAPALGLVFTWSSIKSSAKAGVAAIVASNKVLLAKTWRENKRIIISLLRSKMLIYCGASYQHPVCTVILLLKRDKNTANF